MTNLKLSNRAETLICCCGLDDDTLVSLERALSINVPEAEVVYCQQLNDVSATVLGRQYFLLFVADENEWSEDDHLGKRVLSDKSSLGSFALTDSADIDFLRRLFESGVDDYYLNVPAGWSAALARIARESQKHFLSQGPSSPIAKGESLAERVRRVTFRETVATINHQINNPLSEILATVEMLCAQETELSASAKTRLLEIQKSARRIGYVTDQLLDLVNPESYLTPAGKMIELPTESSRKYQSRMQNESALD